MDIKDFIVSEDDSVIEVMKVIDKNAKGIAFICEKERLLAVVTDGDIRRYILKNGDLNNLIKNIANYSPKYATKQEAIDYTAYMKQHSITALPIVNRNLKLLSIRFLYDNQT